MSLVVVTPPASLPVTLVETKKHLRVDFADDDTLITRLIGVATSMIDGPDSPIGRSLITQTLELRLNGFPGCHPLDVFDRQAHWSYDTHRHSAKWNEIVLPLPPYKSDLTVTYLDADGVTQTLDSAVFRVIGGGSGSSRVSLGYNQAWPATQWLEESVKIQWKAGYGDTADKVPEPIRHAILLLVGHFYENRETEVVGSRAAAVELPTGASALLAPFRRV